MDLTEEHRIILSKVDKLEIEVATHEVQCEERWKTCFQRLGDVEKGLLRVESRMLAVGGTVVLFLAGIIVTLVSNHT